ncbi:MAG: amidohydrolase family protein [Acidimicrobiales bacterium]|nr:amidohydrolase family protein [Acidimicrobiales bacterium]
MRADDLILVSVDDHICEPADMFDAHVPAAYKDHAPRVITEESGHQQWWYGDRRGRNLGLNAVAGKPPEYFNINPMSYDEMRAGCYDVHERVRDMSAGGTLAGLNFPNWPGFTGQVLNEGPDPEVNLVMVKAYNDWHVDEWCGAYPDRFIPCGILPYFDVEEAAKEVRRLADKGCHAVTFSENPAAIGAPSIHSGAWDPLFAACCDTNTVLCCHIGSSSKGAVTVADAPAAVPISLSPAMSIYTFEDLLWADFWHRFPSLRFSLTEGDVGWIPYFLQRADHVYKRHNAWIRAELPFGAKLPSEVFLDRILCCFIEDRVGVGLLHLLNTDNVCWESDYPHSDSNWPDGPERLAELFEGVDDATVNKITHENAMRHFSFDPYSVRQRERCTAGVLRAEATDVDTVTRVGRPADETDLQTWTQITRAAAGMAARA